MGDISCEVGSTNKILLLKKKIFKVNDLLSEHAILKQDLVQSQKDLKELTENRKNERKQLRTCLKQYIALHRINDLLRKKVSDLQKERDELFPKINSLDSSVTCLQSLLKVYKTERKELKMKSADCCPDKSFLLSLVIHLYKELPVLSLRKETIDSAMTHFFTIFEYTLGSEALVDLSKLPLQSVPDEIFGKYFDAKTCAMKFSDEKEFSKSNKQESLDINYLNNSSKNEASNKANLKIDIEYQTAEMKKSKNQFGICTNETQENVATQQLEKMGKLQNQSSSDDIFEIVPDNLSFINDNQMDMLTTKTSSPTISEIIKLGNNSNKSQEKHIRNNNIDSFSAGNVDNEFAIFECDKLDRITHLNGSMFDLENIETPVEEILSDITGLEAETRRFEVRSETLQSSDKHDSIEQERAVSQTVPKIINNQGNLKTMEDQNNSSLLMKDKDGDHESNNMQLSNSLLFTGAQYLIKSSVQQTNSSLSKLTSTNEEPKKSPSEQISRNEVSTFSTLEDTFVEKVPKLSPLEQNADEEHCNSPMEQTSEEVPKKSPAEQTSKIEDPTFSLLKLTFEEKVPKMSPLEHTFEEKLPKMSPLEHPFEEKQPKMSPLEHTFDEEVSRMSPLVQSFEEEEPVSLGSELTSEDKEPNKSHIEQTSDGAEPNNLPLEQTSEYAIPKTSLLEQASNEVPKMSPLGEASKSEEPKIIPLEQTSENEEPKTSPLEQPSEKEHKTSPLEQPSEKEHKLSPLEQTSENEEPKTSPLGKTSEVANNSHLVQNSIDQAPKKSPLLPIFSNIILKKLTLKPNSEIDVPKKPSLEQTSEDTELKKPPLGQRFENKKIAEHDEPKSLTLTLTSKHEKIIGEMSKTSPSENENTPRQEETKKSLMKQTRERSIVTYEQLKSEVTFRDRNTIRIEDIMKLPWERTSKDISNLVEPFIKPSSVAIDCKPLQENSKKVSVPLTGLIKSITQELVQQTASEHEQKTTEISSIDIFCKKPKVQHREIKENGETGKMHTIQNRFTNIEVSTITKSACEEASVIANNKFISKSNFSSTCLKEEEKLNSNKFKQFGMRQNEEIPITVIESILKSMWIPDLLEPIKEVKFRQPKVPSPKKNTQTSPSKLDLLMTQSLNSKLDVVFGTENNILNLKVNLDHKQSNNITPKKRNPHDDTNKILDCKQLRILKTSAIPTDSPHLHDDVTTPMNVKQIKSPTTTLPNSECPKPENKIYPKIKTKEIKKQKQITLKKKAQVMISNKKLKAKKIKKPFKHLVQNVCKILLKEKQKHKTKHKISNNWIIESFQHSDSLSSAQPQLEESLFKHDNHTTSSVSIQSNAGAAVKSTSLNSCEEDTEEIKPVEVLSVSLEPNEVGNNSGAKSAILDSCEEDTVVIKPVEVQSVSFEPNEESPEKLPSITEANSATSDSCEEDTVVIKPVEVQSVSFEPNEESPEELPSSIEAKSATSDSCEENTVVIKPVEVQSVSFEPNEEVEEVANITDCEWTALRLSEDIIEEDDSINEDESVCSFESSEENSEYATIMLKDLIHSQVSLAILQSNETYLCQINKIKETEKLENPLKKYEVGKSKRSKKLIKTCKLRRSSRLNEKRDVEETTTKNLKVLQKESKGLTEETKSEVKEKLPTESIIIGKKLRETQEKDIGIVQVQQEIDERKLNSNSFKLNIDQEALEKLTGDDKADGKELAKKKGVKDLLGQVKNFAKQLKSKEDVISRTVNNCENPEKLMEGVKNPRTSQPDRKRRKVLHNGDERQDHGEKHEVRKSKRLRKSIKTSKLRRSSRLYKKRDVEETTTKKLTVLEKESKGLGKEIENELNVLNKESEQQMVSKETNEAKEKLPTGSIIIGKQVKETEEKDYGITQVQQEIDEAKIDGNSCKLNIVEEALEELQTQKEEDLTRDDKVDGTELAEKNGVKNLLGQVKKFVKQHKSKEDVMISRTVEKFKNPEKFVERVENPRKSQPEERRRKVLYNGDEGEDHGEMLNISKETITDYNRSILQSNPQLEQFNLSTKPIPLTNLTTQESSLESKQNGVSNTQKINNGWLEKKSCHVEETEDQKKIIENPSTRKRKNCEEIPLLVDHTPVKKQRIAKEKINKTLGKCTENQLQSIKQPTEENKSRPSTSHYFVNTKEIDKVSKNRIYDKHVQHQSESDAGTNQDQGTQEPADFLGSIMTRMSEQTVQYRCNASKLKKQIPQDWSQSSHELQTPVIKNENREILVQRKKKLLKKENYIEKKQPESTSYETSSSNTRHSVSHLEGQSLEVAREALITYIQFDMTNTEEAAFSIKSCMRVLHNLSDHSIASAITYIILENVDEALDLSSTPPSPPLTKTQHRLIVLLFYLLNEVIGNRSFGALPQLIFKMLRSKVLPETWIWPDDSIESAARFLTALARFREDVSMAWSLCVDSLYLMPQRACLVVHTALVTWPDVLMNMPPTSQLPKTFAHIILTTGKLPRPRQVKKLKALKHLLMNFYQFNNCEPSQMYLKSLFQKLEVGEDADSLVLLVRCKGWHWTCLNVISHLLTLLQPWVDKHSPVALKVLAEVLTLIPVGDDNVASHVSKITEILSQQLLSGSLSHSTEESIVRAIVTLHRHTNVATILEKWCPKEAISDTLHSIIINLPKNTYKKKQIASKKVTLSNSQRKKKWKKKKKRAKQSNTVLPKV